MKKDMELEKYPEDRDWAELWEGKLSYSLEEVRNNFARFGLLDDNVKFIKGLFKDIMLNAPIEKIWKFDPVQRAINLFREKHGITATMQFGDTFDPITYWQKGYERRRSVRTPPAEYKQTGLDFNSNGFLVS